MQIITDTSSLQAAIEVLKKSGKKIGFVPTMGALHAGHLSLVALAKAHADIVVVSIFVNPTQFAPHEDFASYPRTVDTDSALLQVHGADILFLPTEADIYPDGKESVVKAGMAAKGLESDFRPHFFDGVVNVVHRLLKAVKPDIAVFGEKDWQQLCVVREMVEALKLPIDIIGGPIFRDEEGLALSSRNAYLSGGEIEIARQLNKMLRTVADKIKNGQTEKEVIESASNILLTLGFDKVDYIAHRDGRVLGAVWLGKTRLIDNMAV
jgi:pantoate--beta-alanine ligase